MARSPRGRGLIEFDRGATVRGIQISARNAKGQYTSLQGVVLRANERALRYLQDEAAKNLQESISRKGNPQERNSGRLLRAIEEPRTHLIGPREQRRTGERTGAILTRIGRPVPAYGYASKARRSMLAGRVYQNYLAEEAAKVGANITVS
jgi:hypothetical protein